MKLYTITEMARALNIPPSTTSYYKDRHKDFLPFTGSGRKKRYKEEALEALKIIVEMANNNATTEVIDGALSNTRIRNIEVQQKHNNGITTVQQQSIQQVKFIKLLNRIANQKKEIQELREDVNELKKYIKNNKLSWWQKLLKRLIN